MPPRNPYLEAAVLTASPARRLVLLYDGLIRRAQQAREALCQGEFDSAHDSLGRCQAIVTELIASLNFDVDAEFAGTVLELYHYVYRRLAEANVHHRRDAIDDVLAVVRLQRDAWAEAVRRLSETTSADNDGRDEAPPAGDSQFSLRG
jgi:flagellar protein FliS